MSHKQRNKEKKELEAQVSEVKLKIIYAECYTPHKVGYYYYQLTQLLNKLINY